MMIDRPAVLALYRQLLRVADGMPTGHRRSFVLQRVREEFRKHTAAAEGTTEQARLYQLGITMLEQAESQRKHLTECKREMLLDCELTPEEKANDGPPSYSRRLKH